MQSFSTWLVEAHRVSDGRAIEKALKKRLNRKDLEFTTEHDYISLDYSHDSPFDPNYDGCELYWVADGKIYFQKHYGKESRSIDSLPFHVSSVPAMAELLNKLMPVLGNKPVVKPRPWWKKLLMLGAK